MHSASVDARQIRENNIGSSCAIIVEVSSKTYTLLLSCDLLPCVCKSEGHMSSRSEDLKGCELLLVEDSWHIAQAVKELVEEWGMVVVGPAASAEEAKRLIVSIVPPIAIVDITLRGGLAIDLVDLLYEKGVSVIIASGYSDLFVHESKIAAILHKPFPSSELRAVLTTVVALRGKTQ